jgi:hypothetical protein
VEALVKISHWTGSKTIAATNKLRLVWTHICVQKAGAVFVTFARRPAFFANASQASLPDLFNLVVTKHPDVGGQGDEVSVGEVLRIRFVGRNRPQ